MENSSPAHHGQSLLIGIVTVTYNSGSFIEEFVESCAAQNNRAFKVYCIDNASKDNTKEELEKITDPQWRITFNKKNVGVAQGNNQGVVQALEDNCEWVLLLNNDTTFPVDFFDQLIHASNLKKWRVVVPKIYYDIPARHIWYAGGGFNAKRGHTGYHVGKDQPDRGQFDKHISVEYAPTCAMLVHKDVFSDVGLMDESYFVYFDDTDFCWRLGINKVAIGYWPNTTLVHKVGGSTGGGDSPFSALMTSRNRLYFIKKHFGSLQALLWIPIFTLYYIGRYIVFSQNIDCFRASITGIFEYAAMKPVVPTVPPFGYSNDSK